MTKVRYKRKNWIADAAGWFHDQRMHINVSPSILYFGTPVVLISTRNLDGTTNVAPMSSAWWLGWSCMLGFGAHSKTPQNLQRTRQCTINLPSVAQVSGVDRLARLTGSDPVPPGNQAKGYQFCSDKFAASGFSEAAAELVAAPLVTVGYGVFVERRNIRMREQKIVIPGLAEDLDGLRIVQLTDIHLSPFLSVRELAHAVGMANETNAHLALVTGDMISGQRDPLDACLENLAQLRSEAGIFGCLGNHEIYAHAENYATTRGAELGIRYLRSEAVRLKFGGAAMNLAGVDYQRFNEPYLMGAEDMVQPGMLNVLMSHNPDVFPVAADLGYALTIAGHTHGGQVRVEILREDLNIARFFTPYVDGLYQEGGRTIFVSRGIGTIGLPARLGAPPEVALLRLCRS